MALPEENPLRKWKKTSTETFDYTDWNGVLDEVGGALLVLKAKAAGFDAVAGEAIEVLLKRINDVLGPAYDRVEEQAAAVEARLAQLNGAGVSADAVLETPARVFLTPELRTLLLTAAQADDLAALQEDAACISSTQLFTTGW